MMYAAVVAGVLLSLSVCYSASADERLVVAIRQAADTHGVSASQMIRVARCESQLGEFDFGDNRHSHGPFMLNDRPTGLLWHFYFVGYTNPYGFWQSSDYFARVLSGEFTRDRATILRFGPNVRASRWSCW